MPKDKHDVFISYSRVDYKDANNEPIPNSVISQITTAFKKNNITYWIDENGIYTGDNFAPKIAEAIKNSSVFVFVSTENSNSSQWTQSEICVAQSLKKPILPVKCDESTYATSVIMYLAMLDYCDYKNSPNAAIQQLVDSVKEKLPHDRNINSTIKKTNDEDYKEKIIDSISEINRRFVDISQIAVSQILEANERSRESIEEIGKLVDGRSREKLEELSRFKEETHSHIEYLLHTSKDNTSKICDRLEVILRRMEETNNSLEKICDAIYSLEKKQYPHCGNKANIIFVIDVSGSMEGQRINTLNTIMTRLTSRFGELYNTYGIKFLLSVLPFSTKAEWMYKYPIEMEKFHWQELEANGLTSLGLALDELRQSLSFDNGMFTDTDMLLQPLIVFISDGGPTDNWEKPLELIQQNGIFKKSNKRVITIGDDADIDIFSQLSYQGVVKTRGDFDVEYAISDIISGYINEIISNRIQILKQS